MAARENLTFTMNDHPPSGSSALWPQIASAGVAADGKVLETERLLVRRLEARDAAFILELVNDPSWLRFIGDKGIRSLADAERYIAQGPVAMYARHGFGLFRVETKGNGQAIGICGLLQRETLPDVDLGFAFLPFSWGHGYAFESAAAVMTYGRTRFGLNRLVAVTAPENEPSARLLQKLGFRYEKIVRLGTGPEVSLYAVNLSGASGRAT